MAFEQRPGSGVLFKNNRKGDNEKAPDYTGNALSPSGEYFELSAWIKEGAKGKFMSISLKPKFEPGQQQNRPVTRRTNNDFLDSAGNLDDCPF